MTPAATLKALRLRAGFTQQQLADKAGLDRSWVNQMERGKRTIGPSPRQKLAEALGVSPLEFGDDGEQTPEYRSLLDRLQVLEAELAKERRSRERAIRAAILRLAALEAALELRAPGRAPRSRGRAT